MKYKITLLINNLLLSCILSLYILPNKALAEQTLLKCETEQYRIKIQKNFNRYVYIAWEKRETGGFSESPSLVLTKGKYFDDGQTNDSHVKSYTFRNGRYIYEVLYTPMTGGLSITYKGRYIYSEHADCDSQDSLPYHNYEWNYKW